MLRPIIELIEKTPLGQEILRRRFWRWTEWDESAFNFYRQFIDPGDVVIDVGANRGNRSKIFIKLRALTIMVEPQASCLKHLKTMFRRTPNGILIDAALGSAEGEKEMFISSADFLSTFSPEWLAAVKESGRFGNATWNDGVKVRIITLDSIIARYGLPAFVKIDVEGYESEVLAGLSVAPKAVSFEFTPENIAATFNCIDRLLSLADFEFQVSLYESMAFKSEHWLGAHEIKDYLQGQEVMGGDPECFGDIYARRIG